MSARWRIAWGIAILLCIPIILGRASSDYLLSDTDTAVLLRALRDRGDPLSWFASDWPLGNHFYRPISTLLFEFDLWMHGSRAAGYGWTNAILACLTLLALFWLVREAVDQPAAAVLAAALFLTWTIDAGPRLARWTPWMAGAAVLLGVTASFVREGARGLVLARIAPALMAGSVLIYFGRELEGIARLEFRIVGWLPGRTASAMALCALASLAAYARFERLRREARAPIDHLAPPATRSSDAPRPPRTAWHWAVVSLSLLALALGAYEQAVMLPGVLLSYAVWRRLEGERPAWSLAAIAWTMMIGYVILRFAVIPAAPSDYQRQQFRDGPGVLLSLWDYAFPAAREWPTLSGMLDLGPGVLLHGGFYQSLVLVLGNVFALVALWQSRWLRSASWFLLASFFAFLPMAWLKHFDHYHYWPMGLRAAYVVLLGYVAARLAVNAASPPALAAPPRRDPAPGSLLRR